MKNEIKSPIAILNPNVANKGTLCIFVFLFQIEQWLEVTNRRQTGVPTIDTIGRNPMPTT